MARKGKRKNRQRMFKNYRPPQPQRTERERVDEAGRRRVRWAREILSAVDAPPEAIEAIAVDRRLRGEGWSKVVDDLVARHAPEAVAGAFGRYFDPVGLNVNIKRGPGCVLLYRDGSGVALITATTASLQRQIINGNFVADGLQWARLRDSLVLQRDHPKPTALRVVEAEGWRVVTEFPTGAESGLRERAIAASKRIRTERVLDYGDVPVILDGPDYAIRFEPIRQRQDGPVELPFTFWVESAEPVRGALRLRTPADPLAIVWPGERGEQFLPRVWETALVGFSTLTCEAAYVNERPAAHRPASPGRRHVSDRSVPAARSSRSGQKRLVTPGLVATPATERVLASFVAGHRRRLSGDAHARDEAKAAAAQLGIQLREHETWVRPHIRGVPEGVELHFRLTGPEARSAAA